ncbi:MAG: hypothetical protein ACR2KI_06135 [Candidatus Limnocylindria bacterium]
MAELRQPIPDRLLLARGRAWLRSLDECDLEPPMALVDDRGVGRPVGSGVPFALAAHA